MNRYDKEINVINDFQELRSSEIALIPETNETISILESIHSIKRWGEWIDSSSKSDLPPDFYNPNLKLMMDVMRIDDHTHIDEKGKIINPHNKRESELFEELIKENNFIKELVNEGHVFIVPTTNLSTEEDHNYKFYIDCFNRVVNKHLSKIDNYKKNHLGYKIIFFVVDESSPYIKCSDRKKIKSVGEKVNAKLHFWWRDKNMISYFKDTEVDYLIWMTPYKHFESEENVELPCAMILDVKKYNYNSLIKYNLDEMESLEL